MYFGEVGEEGKRGRGEEGKRGRGEEGKRGVMVQNVVGGEEGNIPTSSSLIA
jgi:hypothetical protein